MPHPDVGTVLAALSFGKGRKAAAVLVSAGLLAACVGGTQTGSAYISAFYEPQVVAYVTKGGAMPLEVIGQPFAGMDGSDTARQVAKRMKLPGWFATRDFAPAPVEGAPSGNYRTVLVFNSAELTTDADDACKDAGKIKVTPPGDRIYVIAAFCAGDEVVTDTYGSTVAMGPDTGEYQQLMTQITMALFPSRSPDSDFGPDIPMSP